MTKRIVIIIALVLAIVVLACACKSAEQIEAEQQAASGVPNVIVNPPAEEEKNTVTVSGSGVVNVEPDMATLSLAVATSNEDAVAAQDENATVMQAVLDALSASGVAESDVVTSGIELYEQYDYSKEPAELTGFEMTNSVTVTVRKLDDLGKIIAAAIEAGATNVNSVSLDISESGTAYTEALTAAMTDAAGKAEALSAAAGCTLGQTPVSIAEQSYSYSPVVYRDVATAEMADAATASAAPISQGELTVSAEITVIYELIPDA